ncbi:sulfotransferase family protein [Halanaerobium kushneri]|uniref:Sulfotransferase family protein n=1 Tax=Halanaerobium kushneri TaxID=56779 RepID=A0A1N7B5R9_9FIRM|nr:sulfotransferase [Halanaerobium kushneri]SIR46648.1 Sulfotransferase family protein [Halanaerobium kushneri]
MKTIVYIAGYGRSGSTLLERILGSNKKLFGLGEVKFLFNSLMDNDSYCSCGEKILKCDYWSKVIKETNLNDINYLQELERLRRKNEYLHTIIFNNKNEYTEILNDLYKSFIEYTPTETKYVIDSSKTARDSFFRPFILSKNLNVKVIHLVRDGRGCMWSNIKGSNRKIEKGLDPKLKFPSLRTAISWSLANLSPQIFQYKYSNNYIRVKYEDFVENPDKSLSRISKYLDVDLSEQINMLKKQKEIPLGHQLAGNRLRNKKKIILRNDDEWKEKLNLYNRLVFTFFSWPFALKYKYFFNEKK